MNISDVIYEEKFIQSRSRTYIMYRAFALQVFWKKNRLFQLFSRYSKSSRRWGVRVCDQCVLKEMRCCIEKDMGFSMH